MVLAKIRQHRELTLCLTITNSADFLKFQIRICDLYYINLSMCWVFQKLKFALVPSKIPAHCLCRYHFNWSAKHECINCLDLSTCICFLSADATANRVDISTDNPNSPYPKISQLLMGNVWLQGNDNVTAAMMVGNPDTTALCRRDGTNIVKPLFFHVSL